MKKYEEITVMKGEGVRGGFYWPSITRLSDGRLMAGSSGFRVKHICPFGEVAVNYSSDEGKTWSAPESVLNTPLDDRDAGVVEYNGKIYIDKEIIQLNRDELVLPKLFDQREENTVWMLIASYEEGRLTDFQLIETLESRAYDLSAMEGDIQVFFLSAANQAPLLPALNIH